MLNPFDQSILFRKKIIENLTIKPNFSLNGSGFICALITSRCPVGCSHCMFAANMLENTNEFNTFTDQRTDNLLKLVKDSNTNYLLVSGGGEPFLHPELMYKIATSSSALMTWFVTSGFWAKNKKYAISILDNMYQAFLKGIDEFPNRKVCIRLSLDFQHVEKISKNGVDELEYVINIIKFFSDNIGNNSNFFFQIHSIEGNETLVEQLIDQLNGKLIDGSTTLHAFDKKTESYITVETPSGYIFDVTYAKLLLSNLAPNLKDIPAIKKSIAIWEKDHNVNEKGHAPLQINSDQTIGSDMLVIYDGRVSGAWQSEMPDVSLNIDTDSYQSIIDKSFNDLAVLATIEKGLDYRFGVISEVSENACIRAKAVNIRDYTSPVLMEEDAIKLYYTIRAAQDYIKEQRLTCTDQELNSILGLDKTELIKLFIESESDIIKQFYKSDALFSELIDAIEMYFKDNEINTLIDCMNLIKDKDSIKLDKFRLLIKRINNSWYDIKTWSKTDLEKLNIIENELNIVLKGKIGIYEGLSRI